jgi:hypothetical protein
MGYTLTSPTGMRSPNAMDTLRPPACHHSTFVSRQPRVKWVITFLTYVQRAVIRADGHGAHQAACIAILLPAGFSRDEASAVAVACDLQT